MKKYTYNLNDKLYQIVIYADSLKTADELLEKIISGEIYNYRLKETKEQ